MLQANNEHGKPVTLAFLDKAEILKIRKEKTSFYCPACGASVIAKTGAKKIPHFAHAVSADCVSGSGGEGLYHEQGKLLIYQWLEQQGLEVQLEAYIQEISQRPDILLTLNGRKIAIEYQCAKIPSEQIIKRTSGYMAAGIIPIWIIGARRFVRYQQYIFQLPGFLEQFIHQFSETTPQTLYFFCPDSKSLIIIQDIWKVKGGRALGRIWIAPIPRLTFADLFHPIHCQKAELIKSWKREKRIFRLRPPVRLYGNELIWHHWLYGKGLHPQNLPSEIFLPVASQLLMKNSLWDWQSKICLEIIQPLPISGTFTAASCKRLLRKSILPPDRFPLLRVRMSPIEQYLRHLGSLGIIRELSAGKYQKLKPLRIHQTIEEALAADEKALCELFKES